MTTSFLKPFFRYYVGKWKLAPKYPQPKHNIIIEPFAGSAGYSLRYPDKSIILIDIDPNIYLTWQYLINVKESEILALPDIEMNKTVDDYNICDEAKILIGWWLNQGSSTPKKRPSSWVRTGSSVLGWGDRVRHRIANQLQYIRHWCCSNEQYYLLDGDFKCTWFIDPPYQVAGSFYRYGSKRLDYRHLATWCQSLIGQVIVCESIGADWLPFSYLALSQYSGSKHGSAKGHEVIYYQDSNNNNKDTLMSNSNVIHSSLSPLLNPSLDFYYPARHTEIGIRITQSANGNYYLHSESPNPWTITTGEDLGSQEDISITDLDSVIRSLLLTMAEHCRNLAAEMEAQAVRLESIAAADTDTLLSDLSTPHTRAKQDETGRQQQSSSGSKPGKQVSRRPSNSTRLSLDLEDLDLD